MNPVIRLLLTVAAAAAAVPCQAYEVRLEPKDRVIAAGHDVVLTLLIDVHQDAEVPATLLSGLRLDTRIGDAAGPTIEEDALGMGVKLTAGTKMQRPLTVAGARLALPPAEGLVDVTFTWKDVPSATAVVKVAPDTSKLALADLDLGKTKVLLLTNHGQMVVRFFPDKAPKHVENFIKLAKDRFYDGTRFHRVIKGFMIQGGDPATKEDGSGQKLDYTLKLEPSDIQHERGILSMARTPHPDSASSQFFIMHGKNPNLDGQYSAFGIVDSGFDTLDRIADVQVRPNERGEPAAPVQPVVLHAAIVLPVRKGQ